jgi:hypothetical protein
MLAWISAIAPIDAHQFCALIPVPRTNPASQIFYRAGT